MKRFLLLLVLVGVATLAPAKTPGEIDVGGVLRDAPMQGLSGPSRLLSDFRGKPLIINVWASWCGPCRAEMGSLERLSRRNGGKQFAVIGISTDDYPDAARAFLQKSPTGPPPHPPSRGATDRLATLGNYQARWPTYFTLNRISCFIAVGKGLF